jgi:CubicO group peptidase (beta-lactamase class C family)
MFRAVSIVIVFLLVISVNIFSQVFPVQESEQVDMSSIRMLYADSVITQAMEDSIIPGAVLLVLRKGIIVHRKAYGYSMLIPEKKAMTVETIFDLASVTKPVATATSVMILLERGRLRLMDPVSYYIPGFKPWKDPEDDTRRSIRIWHLLTHTSGLPPYAPAKELEERYGSPNPDSMMAYIARVERRHEPQTHFTYSCLNFITLQRIVEAVSGMSLHDFSQKNIFKPLKMKSTGYKPEGNCAATEVLDGVPLLCQVHDPLARILMGGVSGNAGIFSTADDLALFAQMMLNCGELNGQRILSPLTVKAMTVVPEKVKFSERALGWDVKSSYSSNGGDLFPYGSYGHTGYTGTSLWIDPHTQTAVILLTNRVHPDDSNSVTRLRSLVANIVAAAILDSGY